MSLLDWLTPNKEKKKPPSSAGDDPSSGLSRIDSTRPASATRQEGGARPANRKQERLARRELLYAVVRETMVRAGVLSSTYKFKVLSLDPRGRQFLVMVDLSPSGRNEVARLAEVETMIAQSAKSRYDILVASVYWRYSDHVAVGDPTSRGLASASRAAPPMHDQVSQPAALSDWATVPDALQPVPTRPAIDPPQLSETPALQRAPGASQRGGQALTAGAGPAGAAPSYTLLTGFEDTEMPGAEAHDLGGTQYGELR